MYRRKGPVDHAGQMGAWGATPIADRAGDIMQARAGSLFFRQERK